MTALPQTVYQALLSADPWVRYNSMIHLDKVTRGSKETCLAYTQMVRHPRIAGILTELRSWPGPAIITHNNARLLIHKLAFLADIGVTCFDSGIEDLMTLIMQTSPPEGPLMVLGRVPPSQADEGTEKMIWMNCDAPLLTYSLSKMGFNDDSRVRESAETLLNEFNLKGCTCGSSFGDSFQGPGPREAYCPYSALLFLKLTSQFPDLADSEKIDSTLDYLLFLWRNKNTERPFLFGMGSDFHKLKAPFVWYDILHLADTLRLYPRIYGRPEFLEILGHIRHKADEAGLFRAEDVWDGWQDFDFGQTTDASMWISFKVYHILHLIDSPTIPEYQEN